MGNDVSRSGPKPKKVRPLTAAQIKALRIKAEVPALRARATELATRMPPEFQDWGVVRSRAYAAAVAKLDKQRIRIAVRLMGHKPPTPASIHKTLTVLIAAVERMATCDVETCNWSLRTPKEREAFNVTL